MVNKITNRITKLNIRDYGCMLRGYSRRIVEIINVSRESTTFIPARTEIRCQPDRDTGCAQGAGWGLQVRSLPADKAQFRPYDKFLDRTAPVTRHDGGMLISLLSSVLAGHMLLRRLFIGPEAEGCSHLWRYSSCLLAATLFSLGITGEYVGRDSTERC